jgi:hypothetical protein
MVTCRVTIGLSDRGDVRGPRRGDALAQTGDSAEVYNQLAEQSRTEAMNLLGINFDRTTRNGPDRPDGPTAPDGDADQPGPGSSGPDSRDGNKPDLTVPEWLGDWTDPDQTTGPDRVNSRTGEPAADRIGQPDRTAADQTAERTEKANQTGPNQTAGPTSRTSGPNQTGPKRRTGRTGGRTKGSLEELETVCRAWAKQHEVDAAQMSRRDVIEACHGAGYSCSTERASEVQGLLDPKGAPALIGLERIGPDRQ